MQITIQQLKDIVKENSELDISDQPFDDTQTLESLGIDSMGMVSMAFAIEDLTQVVLGDESLGRLKTVGDVRELLSENGVTVTLAA